MNMCLVAARDMKDVLSVWNTAIPVENWKDARDMVINVIKEEGGEARVVLVRIK